MSKGAAVRARLATYVASLHTAALAIVTTYGAARVVAVTLLVLLLLSPWAPLTLAVYLAYVVVTIRRPGLTVALLPAAAPFAYLPKSFFGPRFPVVELLLLAALFAAVLHLVVWWREQARQGLGAATLLDSWDTVRRGVLQPLGLHAVTFGLIATFSLLTVADPSHRHESLREYRVIVVEPLLYYFLAQYWLRDRALRGIAVAAFLTGATAIAFLALVQVVTGSHVVATEGVRRATGVYQHPNNLALYLARALPFAAALLLLAPRPRQERALLVATPLLAIGLVLTFSRGALFGVLVALALLALGLGRREVRVGLLGLLILGVVLVPLVAGSRLRSLTGGGGSLGLRQLIWSSTLAMLRDHPAFGVGLDQFIYQYAPRYVEPAAWGERYTSHPHNLFLDFWARLGIMGLAWLCWLLASLSARLVTTWRAVTSVDDRPLLAAIGCAGVAALVHGLIDNFYFLIDLAFVWWWLLALLQALTTSHDQASVAAEPREGW